MRTLLRALLVLLTIAMLPACGSGGGDSTTILQTDAPASGWLVLLTDNNSLVFVDPANPAVLRRIVPVLSLPAGVTLRAIAIRPATGNLYAFASNNKAYEVDLLTGGAAEVTLSAASMSGPPTYFSVSYSPVSDLLRLVSNLQDNLRLGLGSGGLPPDTDLSASVQQIAYSNNFPGAATTTLYGVDNVNLVRIGGLNGVPSPNGGVVTVVGPHGATPGNGPTGFAIAPSGTAYMAFGNPDLITDLWRVDLATGGGTLLGSTGINIFLGMAVVP